MLEEKRAKLLSYSKEEYTHYLIGYIAAEINHYIENGITVDAEGLAKIAHLVDTSYKHLLAIHDFICPGLEHYKVFSLKDEHETGVDLFYIKDGEMMPTPYGFKLSALDKSNLN